MPSAQPPAPTGLRTARGSLVFLGGGLAVCVLVAVVGEPWRGWLLVALVCAVVAAGVVVVREDPRGRSPLRLLLAGSIALLPAYVIWYPLRVRWGIDLSEASPTDVLFLLGYGCFLAALVAMVRQRSGSDPRIERIQLLDSLIIGVGLAVLVWIAFINPYVRADSLSVTAKVVSTSYTLFDVLLLGGVARLLIQTRVADVGDRLLSGWVIAQMSADVYYSVTSLRGTFSLSGPAPVLYCISFVMLGAAMLHPSTMRVEPILRRAPGLPRLALVGATALIAPGLLVVLGIQGRSHDVAVVAGFSGVLFALVLLRVALLTVDVQAHQKVRNHLEESVEQERERARENQELLASLRERQMLAERLFRIQRKISTRAPLNDVLDAITQGAAELLRDDVVGLRLIDEQDPGTMVMVSSVGVDVALADQLHRLPVGTGVGGRAIAEDRLCIKEDYRAWEGAIGAFADSGLRSAMGAPVHLEGRPIGSLVVASHAAGRHYSAAEREALIGFAEHVSLALNDARTVEAMHSALDRAVHQAMHDELTGLPNRAFFYERTEQALAAGRGDGTATAVLLFDLDRFKEINDTLGHRYGDQVLQAIGPRIAPLLRGQESLARLGGDEFCVLVPGAQSIDAAVELARRVIRALEEPFDVDGMDMAVQASCGVAMAPDHGDTADLLLQRSDVAMYVAKTAHINAVAYEDALDRNTPDRLAMVAELRAAIADGQLCVHYQPQVDLSSGAVESVEALVRWQHPRLGLVSPDEFIPMAEDTGLIRPLTTWVLDGALRQLREWDGDPTLAGAADMALSVNLSTRSLLDDSIRDEVVIALERHGIAADRLVLEITETTLMADPVRAQRVLSDLARVGVRFAIDDFGTGYSSLSLLRDISVHQLKIDKSFVLTLGGGSDDLTIVRSVIDLGRTLGLRTIAEGVESHEAWALLAELGCDAAQGFLLTEPLSGPDLAAWLRERQGTRLRLVSDPSPDKPAVAGSD